MARQRLRVVNDFERSPIKVICDTASNKASRTEENNANADLIAAAPDLLAACEALFAADHHNHFEVRMSYSEIGCARNDEACHRQSQRTG